MPEDRSNSVIAIHRLPVSAARFPVVGALTQAKTAFISAEVNGIVAA